MNKFSLTLVGLIFCFFINIQSANAGIYFLEKSTSVQAQKNERPCPADGYKVTEAECMKQGLTLIDTCPADSRYGKSCSCDQAQFQYTTDNCAAPKSPTGETCNGKYKTCDCASNVYKYYTNTDCPTNKIVDTQTACTYADSKVGYSACTCPSQYSETCTGSLEGVGTACDGKYVSCKCASNYFSCDNGGAAGATSCTDSSGTKYSSCQTETCESKGYFSSQPTTSECSCSAITVANVGTCYKCVSNFKTCKDQGYIYSSVTTPNCTLGSVGDGTYYINTCYVASEGCEYSPGKFLYSAGPATCKCGPNTLYYTYKEITSEPIDNCTPLQAVELAI